MVRMVLDLQMGQTSSVAAFSWDSYAEVPGVMELGSFII